MSDNLPVGTDIFGLDQNNPDLIYDIIYIGVSNAVNSEFGTMVTLHGWPVHCGGKENGWGCQQLQIAEPGK